ncbi:hypothetical protein Stsp02_12260 [Streptomyces sp. NBRC 14336]|nr:hypothetical protein Stsp02_12260 [Streptomyces sp. NBRC 14336]
MSAQKHEACPDPRVEPGQQWIPLIGSPHGGGSGSPWVAGRRSERNQWAIDVEEEEGAVLVTTAR